MRKVIGGDGSDTTLATQAWLASTDHPLIRDLYIIGPPESPYSIWMTDHEAPVFYRPYGTFQPAVVKRDCVQAKVGLDVQSMTITWSPAASAAASQTANTASSSPYQKAAQHFYDNWPVLILRCFMPSPGDAETLGCAVWFGGRVQNCKVGRNSLQFNTKSYLDVISQQVPSTVVESTSTLGSTAAVTLPPGDPSVPTFSAIRPSSNTSIVADCISPSAGKIYAGNQFAHGYMVFLPGAGATLAGIWSGIGANGAFTDGHGNKHSLFQIMTPLPWPPTPGVDSFYVSMTPPANAADGNYFGFPYVPLPQGAV